MTDLVPETINLFLLRPGDRLEIRSPGYPAYTGLVEDSMPLLDVVWIRDLITGERKMLSTAEHRMNHT
jgi:hypothetical protein